MGQIAAIGAFMDSRAGPRLIVPRTTCEDAELLRALDAVAVHVGRLRRGRGGLRGGHGKCSESSRNSKRLHQEECVETMGSGVCRCALYTHLRRDAPWCGHGIATTKSGVEESLMAISDLRPPRHGGTCGSPYESVANIGRP